MSFTSLEYDMTFLVKSFVLNLDLTWSWHNEFFFFNLGLPGLNFANDWIHNKVNMIFRAKKKRKIHTNLNMISRQVE